MTQTSSTAKNHSPVSISVLFSNANILNQDTSKITEDKKAGFLNICMHIYREREGPPFCIMHQMYVGLGS